jgi:hypothetical protein
MFLNTKRLTISGALLAISVILIYLGNVIESSTLFLLAAASFGTGIVYREFGVRSAAVFLIANILLGFLLSPQKLYMLTFSVLALYILLTELLWERLGAMADGQKKRRLFLAAKYGIFNVMYLPVIFLFPRWILSPSLTDQIGGFLYPALILGGQVSVYLFDWAYCHFQDQIWGRIRRHVL